MSYYSKLGFCLVHRKLTADVAEKIAEVEEKVSKVVAEHNNTDTQLNALEADAESLDNVVKELADQLEFIKISDIRGQCSFMAGGRKLLFCCFKAGEERKTCKI